MLRAPALAVLAAGAAAMLPGAPALAAVRSCKPPVASNLSTAPTEPLARKAALESWIAKAKVHGDRYAGWRIAAQKTLKCVKGTAGGFDCIAYGAPCTIEQAPNRQRKAPADKPITI